MHIVYRLVTIFQGTARNHFREAGMLLQSCKLCCSTPALSAIQRITFMQITEVKYHQVQFSLQKLDFLNNNSLLVIFFSINLFH